MSEYFIDIKLIRGCTLWLLFTIIILLAINAKSCVNRNSNKTKSGSSTSAFIISMPSNLTATAASFYEIKLSWQDNSNNEDGFDIERSVNGINYFSLATVYSNVISYSDNSVTPSNTYYYRVRAFNTIGDKSNWTNPANALTFNWDWVPVSWTAVSAGRDHTIAVAINSTLWSWGNNSYGQLGLGDWDTRLMPILVASDNNWNQFTNIGNVMATKEGNYGGFSFATKTDGTSWAFGANGLGQLGLGDTFTANAPVQIGNTSDWLMIAPGDVHIIGLKVTGTIWSWGNNDYGQLGLGFASYSFINLPTQIGTSYDWSGIASGSNHSIAIKTNRTIWSWGNNWNGQLGRSGNTTTPRQIGIDSDWSSMVGGQYHSLALKIDRTLWAWGLNGAGQLGDPNIGGSSSEPYPVGTNSDWSLLSAGVNHNLGLKTNGTLWTWGLNDQGQLGLGYISSNVNTPTQIGINSDWSVISAGYGHNFGIRTNGILWGWGQNNNGELGIGDTANRSTPVLIGN